MATITKLPSGKFKAIIRRHGRARCKTFSRKTDARTWANRIEASQETMDAMGLPGASMTLAELGERYLAQWSGRDVSAGFKTRFWQEALGQYRLIDITPEMVRAALNEYGAGAALRADGVDRPGHIKLKATSRIRRPATVNRMKSALSAMFKYAIGEGLANRNPTAGIPIRTENNKRIRYLSDVERRELLRASKASPWDKLYLLVMMALTTGARRGELLGLRWSHFDFSRGLAHLAMTKNGEPRVLPLPSPTLAELERWREVGNGLVFPSAIKPNHPFEFRKAWANALAEADIDNFRFHDLRHSAASYLVMNGASLAETAEVLGHKSIQTTMRYAHLSTEHKAALTERIMGNMGSDDG